MPTTTDAPSKPTPTIAPTPTAEWRTSEHSTNNPLKSDPLSQKLHSRLEEKFGASPERPTGEVRMLPSQPPRVGEGAPPAPSTAAADADQPASHVKFITADDAEPAAPSPTPTVAPDDKSEVPAEVFKSASAQVREAYERAKANLAKAVTEGDLTKKELATHKAQLQSYTDRLKVLESAEGRAKDAETRALALDEQLRVTNYTQHPEFHERYVKPVAEAVQSARALVQELMVTGEDGSRRMGTAEDFNAVLGQPNHTLALEKAEELFGGKMAQTVADEARRVRSLRQAQAKAVESANVTSLEWTKRQQEQMAQQRLAIKESFESAARTLSERYPGLYLPTEATDREAVEARSNGEKLATLVLGKPEEMPLADYTNAMAKVYQRAASFPLKELTITRLQKELETTKARLAQYEKSSPDTASAQRPGGVTEIGATPVNTSGDKIKAHARGRLEEMARRGY